MGEFFTPVWRKIGVITLGLACVFMVGWLRSFRGTDYLNVYPSDDKKHELIFNRGTIRLERSEFGGRFVSQQPLRQLRWTYVPFVPADHATELKVNMDGMETTESIRQFWGIEAGEYQLSAAWGTHYRCYWQMTYCWIVIPLGFLSAWLLLIKPRAKTTALHSETTS